jgi:hypothetical protein
VHGLHGLLQSAARMVSLDLGPLRRLLAFPLLTRALDKEISAAHAVMYIMIGCVGYYRLGADFDKSKPVTSVLPQDIWTSLANVGLLAHCIIAYMVRSFYLPHSTGVLVASSTCRNCMLCHVCCSMHVS